ncbi:MAG: four helix bundle protein [Phycisphaerales bacterium]|nr:four helix bundle protein [Phycisphaerales bacterium]
MSEIKTFRDLRVWQCGMDLARAVYQSTAEMPDTERFGLVTQMRRAAVSIPSNIAEGYARQTRKEYIRYLRMTRGSLAELDTQDELATSLELMRPSEAVAALLREEDRMLQALLMRLEHR